jgi:hypothetical protein
MATVRLRNINPLGHVDLPLINRQGDEHLGVEGIGNLEPGEVFDGPDAAARADRQLRAVGHAAAEAYGYVPRGTEEALDPQIEPNPAEQRPVTDDGRGRHYERW